MTKDLQPIVKYLFLFLFLPFSIAAQKIKSSAADPATKRWRVESYPVTLKAAPEVKMDLSLQTLGDSLKLKLSGAGLGANTILEGDAVIFLLDNDSTVTARSVTVQTFERGSRVNTYSHVYVLSLDNLEALSRRSLQGLRKYSTEGHDDVYVEKPVADKLKDICAAVVEELKKAGVMGPRRPLAVPTFPGGKEVLLGFLNRNLKPLTGLQGTERKFAIVEFRVEADGTITDMDVKQSAGTTYDTELLRILKRMPRWKPAQENGKAIATTVMQPVTFLRTGGKVSVRI